MSVKVIARQISDGFETVYSHN